MRKLAGDLVRGDIIVCRNDGWYAVDSKELDGRYVWVSGDSDICDDDLPMQLLRTERVTVED